MIALERGVQKNYKFCGEELPGQHLLTVREDPSGRSDRLIVPINLVSTFFWLWIWIRASKQLRWMDLLSLDKTIAVVQSRSMSIA